MGNKTICLETATFAGGCFWCTESDFEQYRGVEKAIPGYTGGHKEHPTYEEVCSGRSGHLEAVQVEFDSGIVTYERMLELFWRSVDPTDAGGQFFDRGSQYRTAIFFHSDRQRHLAEASKTRLARSQIFKRPIATEIIPFEIFYPAENYHQGYYKKNPIRYKFYRNNSGRDQFLNQIWQGTAKFDR